MNLLDTRRYPLWVQYLICVGTVLLASGTGLMFRTYTGVRVVALMQLLAISIVAMLFDLFPVVAAAVLSMILWTLFATPMYMFHIDNSGDELFFFLFFVIVVFNIATTFKVRQAERRARERDEKDRVIRLYNTLLNSLSHELRTPIATIIGALDTLRENRAVLSEQDKAELIGVIEKAGFRLDREVGNLLNMSRLESGMLKLQIDWCDTGEVIWRCIRKLNPEAGNLVTFLPAEDLPYFRIDDGILEQVVYNLVHNAIRHTPAGTHVEVGLRSEAGACVITVSDNGPGFPEEEIGRAFDKFHRLTNSKAGGSGLGLSIVKGYTEAHGGTVKLENGPQGGARFTVTIPAESMHFNNL